MDTIRILVSSDNHVGFAERDPIRGDDSWRTFDEVLALGRSRDVDMVLLAGDVFHENKPSRKSLYGVMGSLRRHCLGDRPCELELLSDGSETLSGAFKHVNYEDPDVNVALPVFAVHGNHDEPSGAAQLAALDVVAAAGLINYFGRAPESDRVAVRPLLFQKGRSKLALYGLGNVRDERLHRTFRDGRVRFFRPSVQRDDWFNLIALHQNHAGHSDTGYLPEAFLPDFLDLVVWGHEHECLPEPRTNPEMGFSVIQPGSTVATSLVAGEAAAKHAVIVNITGREMEVEPVRLRTVRPFVTREVVLAEQLRRAARGGESGRTEVTRYLTGVVEEMIEQAREEWEEESEATAAAAETEEPREPAPLPLIRLRVETSLPGGTGSYEVENPQRFSNRFVGRVANALDVVQFYRRKRNTAGTGSSGGAGGGTEPEEPDADTLALDTVRVEKLVREFLAAQSLTILPQNSFGDAVAQFVDKDDRHAMETFVSDALASQVKHLMALGDEDGDEEGDEDGYGDGGGDGDGDGNRSGAIAHAMERHRAQLEEMFARGSGSGTGTGTGIGLRTSSTTGLSIRRYRPKPDNWDSDFDGHWEDQPGALAVEQEGEGEQEEEMGDEPQQLQPQARGRGARSSARAGGRTSTATTGTTTTTTATTSRNRARATPTTAAAPSATTSRARGRGAGAGTGARRGSRRSGPAAVTPATGAGATMLRSRGRQQKQQRQRKRRSAEEEEEEEEEEVVMGAEGDDADQDVLMGDDGDNGVGTGGDADIGRSSGGDRAHYDYDQEEDGDGDEDGYGDRRGKGNEEKDDDDDDDEDDDDDSLFVRPRGSTRSRTGVGAGAGRGRGKGNNNDDNNNNNNNNNNGRGKGGARTGTGTGTRSSSATTRGSSRPATQQSTLTFERRPRARAGAGPPPVMVEGDEIEDEDEDEML